MLARLMQRLRSLVSPTPSTGDHGEDLACTHLTRTGYRVLGRQLPLRFTEVDILAEAPDRRTIVVVEVKTRRRSPGSNEESLAAETAVDSHKRQLLLRATRHLAAANRWYGRPLRIDIIAVELDADPARTLLRHHLDAVQEERQPDQP